MHVVFRESHGLEETETPYRSRPDPADLVVLSFSDSDLGAFAAGWHRAAGRAADPAAGQSGRAARIRFRSTPMSSRRCRGAKGILIRLIGGEAYWPYGLAQVAGPGAAPRDRAGRAAGRRRDRTRGSMRLRPCRSRRCGGCGACAMQGGAVAAQAALAQLALAAGLYAGAGARGEGPCRSMGFYDPDAGVSAQPPAGEGRCVARDLLPRLSDRRGYRAGRRADRGAAGAGFRRATALFAPSLKAPACGGWLARMLAPALAPRRDRQRDRVFGAGRGRARRRSTPRAARCSRSRSSTARPRRLGRGRARAVAGRSRDACGAARGRRAHLRGRREFQGRRRRAIRDLQFSRFAHRADAERIAAVVDRVPAGIGWR